MPLSRLWGLWVLSPWLLQARDSRNVADCSIVAKATGKTRPHAGGQKGSTQEAGQTGSPRTAAAAGLRLGSQEGTHLLRAGGRSFRLCLCVVLTMPRRDRS